MKNKGYIVASFCGGITVRTAEGETEDILFHEYFNDDWRDHAAYVCGYDSFEELSAASEPW